MVCRDVKLLREQQQEFEKNIITLETNRQIMISEKMLRYAVYYMLMCRLYLTQRSRQKIHKEHDGLISFTRL